MRRRKIKAGYEQRGLYVVDSFGVEKVLADFLPVSSRLRFAVIDSEIHAVEEVEHSIILRTHHQNVL